jgi:tetratricopeptide (TPR) repeat protein
MRYLLTIASAADNKAKGRFQDAEAEPRSAIDLRPDWYTAYAILGDLLLERGSTNDALIHYEAALSRCGLTPTNQVPSRVQEFERQRIAEKILALREPAK